MELGFWRFFYSWETTIICCDECWRPLYIKLVGTYWSRPFSYTQLIYYICVCILHCRRCSSFSYFFPSLSIPFRQVIIIVYFLIFFIIFLWRGVNGVLFLKFDLVTDKYVYSAQNIMDDRNETADINFRCEGKKSDYLYLYVYIHIAST